MEGSSSRKRAAGREVEQEGRATKRARQGAAPSQQQDTRLPPQTRQRSRRTRSAIQNPAAPDAHDSTHAAQQQQAPDTSHHQHQHERQQPQEGPPAPTTRGHRRHAPLQRQSLPPLPPLQDPGTQAPVQAPAQPQQPCYEDLLPPIIIIIKWASATGKTKCTELPLKMVASTDDLTGVHKRLTNRVFAERDLPEFMRSEEYLKFSTCEECLNLPLDVMSTNFKLAAFKDGWQYVIHDSRVSSPETSTSQPKLHVTIIEFDTVAHIIGHLGIRMSMVAYPLITVHKEFLLSMVHQLRTDPNFKGIFAE